MGHNDVCQNTFAEIPTDAVFEAEFREGMAKLKAGLPAGATVYVVGIVDIYRLWQVAADKRALGIVDCEVLWATSLLKWYPCATMLEPAQQGIGPPVHPRPHHRVQRHSQTGDRGVQHCT